VAGRLFSLFHFTMSPSFRVESSGSIKRAILAFNRKLTRVLSSNSITSAVNSSSLANLTCLMILPLSSGYSIPSPFALTVRYRTIYLPSNRSRKPFSSGEIMARSLSRCRVSCSTVRRKSVTQPSVALLLLSGRGPSTSICRLLNVITCFVFCFCFIQSSLRPPQRSVVGN